MEGSKEGTRRNGKRKVGELQAQDLSRIDGVGTTSKNGLKMTEAGARIEP